MAAQSPRKCCCLQVWLCSLCTWNTHDVLISGVCLCASPSVLVGDPVLWAGRQSCRMGICWQLDLSIHQMTWISHCGGAAFLHVCYVPVTRSWITCEETPETLISSLTFWETWLPRNCQAKGGVCRGRQKPLYPSCFYLFVYKDI